MKIKILVGILLLTLVVLFISMWLRSIESADKTIKIVTSLPMRGISGGQEVINGAKLALKDAGYKAGKFKIELDVKDSGDENGSWQIPQEQANAESAVADKDVMIYFGTYDSGAAKVSIPITNRAYLVQMSPSNTSPGLTKPGFALGEPGIFYPTGVRNYFRVVPTDAAQGPAGALWAKEMGIQSVHLIDDDDTYGKVITTLFSKRAEKVGITIYAHESLSINETDIRKKAQEVRESGVDLVYFGGSVSKGIIPFINELYAEESDIKVMGPDGLMDDSLIQGTGTHAEGIYITTVGIPAKELTGDGKVFFDAYVMEYGSEPGTYSAFAYEAITVALNAIDRAGVKDRRKILNALAEMGEYTGILGTWSFDGNGDTSLSALSGMIVRDGNFIFEKKLSN